jgi:hypothetical protein
MWQFALLVGATLALAACVQTVALDGRDSINGGVIVVSQSATYDYVLQSGCIGAYQFRLQSDSGSTEWFPLADTGGSPQKGNVVLAAGKWQGGWFFRSSLTEEPCKWAISLAAQT